MTHFVSLMVVPKDVMKKGESAVTAYIAERMEPYCEEYGVAPHVDKSKEDVEQEFGNFRKELEEDLKAGKEIAGYKKSLVDNGKVKDISIREWAKDWYGRELNEKGELMSTFNRDSFFDWYRVGGRWDGILTENEQSSENGFNFDGKHETVKNNSIPARILLQKAKASMERIRLYREGAGLIAKQLESDYPFKDFGFADIFREWELLKGQDEKVWHPIYDKIEKRLAQQIREFSFHDDSIFHLIIDLQGKVHAGQTFGWFGFSKKTKSEEEWMEEYLGVLEKAKDHFVVSLDCHV